MTLNDLLSFLHGVDARPKKWLSQNFLIDPHVIEKILQTADVQKGDSVLEIGPGPGALTKALLDRGARVYAVEIDPLFAKELQRFQNGELFVFEEDFLSFPMQRLPKGIKVVANLPYHITAPILERLFASSFSTLTLMVQKEVADRMMAKANTKDFGSLSLFVQFYSEFIGAFTVPAPSFYPKPKVDSSVIRLDAKPLPPVDPAHFFSLVHKAFQQRRKMLTTSLGKAKETVREALCTIGIRPDARPENLSLSHWVKFINTVTF